MKAIWKFPLPAEARFDLPLPRGARILSLQTQNDTPTLWALVDTTAPFVVASFAICGTGHEMPGEPGEFVGTVQVGVYVWHLFRVNRSERAPLDESIGRLEGMAERLSGPCRTCSAVAPLQNGVCATCLERRRWEGQ